jgi:predicted Zn-dependent peptidase
MKHTIHKVNGYTIILVPNDTNTVHINACIKTGSMNESKHDSGIHHLVEHILTESWKPCGKQTCSSYWDKKGIIMNAHTHLSYMNFHVNGLIEDMDEMMNYIVDIITTPFFKKSTLEIEKHAVLNELLIKMNNPENKLYDAFNKEFFIDVYTNDYPLQIKNLKHMNMKKIQNFYEKMNKEIIFVISGPKKMPNFKEHYKQKNEKKDIFTYSNKIIYVPYKQKSTILMMGIPIVTECLFKSKACLQILHMILFQKLRVEMKVIYSINIELVTLPSPHIIIKSTVETKHTPIVYKTIVDTFHKYKTEPFPQEYIDGIKKENKLKYHNTNLNSSFMANYILNEYLNGKIFSLETKLKEVEKMKPKEFMKFVFFDKCVIAYQGPEKILDNSI